jgi:hypothetical protein
MTNKTEIYVEWDRGGRISYSMTGNLPPSKDEARLGYLVPSALLLLGHQLGVMKPSHGLIICGTVLDMLLDNRYILVPINSALKSATIEFLYIKDESVKVQFHPKHGIFANSDSLEEGVRQLLNNYIYFAFTQANEDTKFVYKLAAFAAIEEYFKFIKGQLETNSIGKDNDRWSLSFPPMSNRIIRWVSEHWFVPVSGSETEQWIKETSATVEKQRHIIEGNRSSLFAAMGLN